MDYSDDVPIHVQEIAATSITDWDGNDVRILLKSTDSEYFVMPETGQKAHLVFHSPPHTADMKRTVYAKVSGYYDMHLRAKGPVLSDKINEIESSSESIIQYAIEQYQQWLEEVSTSKYNE
jgi:hypothetical protein